MYPVFLTKLIKIINNMTGWFSYHRDKQWQVSVLFWKWWVFQVNNMISFNSLNSRLRNNNIFHCFYSHWWFLGNLTELDVSPRFRTCYVLWQPSTRAYNQNLPQTTRNSIKTNVYEPLLLVYDPRYLRAVSCKSDKRHAVVLKIILYVLLCDLFTELSERNPYTNAIDSNVAKTFGRPILFGGFRG